MTIPQLSVSFSCNETVQDEEGNIDVTTPTMRTKAKRTYADGSIFEGEWSNDGKWCGRGRFRTKSGDIIEGDEFTPDGKVHGHVTVRCHDGNVYEGGYDLVEMNNPHHRLRKSCTTCIVGKYSGSGKLTKANGTVYEGEFVEGKLTGHGKITWTRNSNKGQVYEGEIVDDKCTGRGKMTWPNGDFYEGDFVDGRRTGNGKLTWVATRLVYDGQFINDMCTGFGKLSQEIIGVIYLGDFRNNAYNGFGKGYYADGTIYEGMWKNDKFHGPGKKKIRTGEIYKGNFIDGKLEGKGTIRFPTGKTKSVKWEKNERVYSKNLKTVAKSAASVGSKVVSRIRRKKF